MARSDVKHERAMADMPGALLLRMGVLQPGDLAAAAALQEREGGSFGECLVRLGAVDEEQLADFYKTRLMITRVPDHRLVDIHKAILGMVSADMAAEFRVLPVDLDGDGLVLAMADPTDNHAVDEVAFFADRFVVRAVATESAIRRAIESHYGVRFTSPRATDPIGASAAPAKATPRAPAAEPPPAAPPAAGRASARSGSAAYRAPPAAARAPAWAG